MSKNTRKTIKASSPLRGLDPKRAGIDIGARSIFVCVCDSTGHQEVREFLTFTRDLEAMSDWLKERGVESIAMESTGVYWIPVFEILDPKGFEVLLCNAHHLKNVPGRKSDVIDCQWIQQLHSHGFLRGSFRPADEFVRLRAYVRQRRQLFERAAIQVQLMQKAFVQMNVQIHLAIGDITGKTGLLIIQAILRGERDPMHLAGFRQGGCKKSKAEIAKSLEGNWREEHILELQQAYDTYEFHHKQVMVVENEISKIMPSLTALPRIEEESKIEQQAELEKPSIEVEEQAPQPPKKIRKKTSYNRSPYSFNAAEQVQRICGGIDLTQVPGLDINTVMVILSEIGTDMSRWRTSKQFASWLGLCPGSKISGGKILSSKTKPTDNRAAHALRLAAHSLYKSQTAIGAFLRRLRARLGAPKAITAAAHKLARIIYRMLKYKVNYQETGADYYDAIYKERLLSNLEKKAREMGFILTLAAT